MEKILEGKAFVLSNNVDTDQIIPAEHLVYSLSDPEEKKMYGKYALSSVPMEKSGLPNGGIKYVEAEKFETEFPIIIGGANFGCGSSREHAPFALQIAGTKVIIAESYARIFFRNAVDGGFVIPYESVDKLNDKIKTGDEVQINLEKNVLKNVTTNEEYKLKPLGDILPILEAGNLFEYARQTDMIA